LPHKQGYGRRRGHTPLIKYIEEQEMGLYEKLKSAASKYWLVPAAGAMWSGVGLMLCHMAYEWLLPVIIT
jgi:hypothetical protein